MDLLTNDHLQELLDHQEQTCISIYLPMFRTGREVQQNALRLKNALKQIEELGERRNLDSRQLQRIVKPAESWLQDSVFWEHQGDGLAIFLAEGYQRRFRLPKSFADDVRIGRQFRITPLLPLLQANGRFYILAASRNTCRLLRGDRFTVEELEAESLPESLNDALGWERERELSFHSMNQGPRVRGGTDIAMFHGHFEDATKEDLEKYFQRIDPLVIDLIRKDDAPLVFAGVDYLFPIFRDVSEYPRLCEQAVTGTPDDARPEELHREAWKIVEPIFRREEREAVSAFGDRSAHGTATGDLDTILRAAGDGLVDTLLIRDKPAPPPADAAEPGAVDGTSAAIDLAVLLTLANSGRVLALSDEDFPGDVPAAALLRAPVSTVAR